MFPCLSNVNSRISISDVKYAGVDKYYYEEYEDSSETDSLSTELTNNTGSNQPWKGFSVVFAGSIYGTNRFELKRISKLLGGKSFPRSVSKSTDNNVHGWKGIQQCFVLYRIEENKCVLQCSYSKLSFIIVCALL